jgi:hypothetical protein
MSFDLHVQATVVLFIQICLIVHKSQKVYSSWSTEFKPRYLQFCIPNITYSDVEGEVTSLNKPRNELLCILLFGAKYL